MALFVYLLSERQFLSNSDGRFVQVDDFTEFFHPN